MIQKRTELVDSPVPGVESRMADIYFCECGGEAFGIFKIVDQSHHHIQCLTCNTSYCFQGSCELGEEIEGCE